MNADSKIVMRADGMHIPADARLAELMKEASLTEFASGLVVNALNLFGASESGWTLAQALHDTSSQSFPLLVTLLVLDAEVKTVVEDQRPVFPLPGFLSYRHSLPLDRFPVDSLRLPPVTEATFFRLDCTDDSFCCAIRMEIHPRMKVAGHVRIAVSSSTRVPLRLNGAEHRLERQPLQVDLIDSAVAAGSKGLSAPLTNVEQAQVRKALLSLRGD
jgi:CO/xanthine dehydrogenase FAD-binding subunit